MNQYLLLIPILLIQATTTPQYVTNQIKLADSTIHWFNSPLELDGCCLQPNWHHVNLNWKRTPWIQLTMCNLQCLLLTGGIQTYYISSCKSNNSWAAAGSDSKWNTRKCNWSSELVRRLANKFFTKLTKICVFIRSATNILTRPPDTPVNLTHVLLSVVYEVRNPDFSPRYVDTYFAPQPQPDWLS